MSKKIFVIGFFLFFQNALAGPLDGSWKINAVSCGNISVPGSLIPATALAGSVSTPNSIRFSFADSVGTETIVSNNGQCTVMISLLISYPDGQSFVTTPTGSYTCISTPASCADIPCGQPVLGSSDIVIYKRINNSLSFTTKNHRECMINVQDTGDVTYSAEKE